MYRDVAAPTAAVPAKSEQSASQKEPSRPAGPTPEEIQAMLDSARQEAEKTTEERLRAEMDTKLGDERARIDRTIELFREERREYFARVESEVVHLALGISAKILHREAQVDPMLVAALVRVAIEKLHDGSSVSVRVNPSEAGRWREAMEHLANGSTVEVVEDKNLAPGECQLETDLGSAEFGIDAQLKEVEQGFFDLLAQRPSIG
jgi:flagellar assembly protein FliH